MVKRQHEGNEENHGTGSWFSGLFNKSNEHSTSNEHSSGLFGNHTTTHDSTSTTHSTGGITFQKIVSYIAAIILAGTLAFIGFMIYNSKTSMKYPPEVAECPDYWESTGPNKCRNTLKVGKCTDADEMDFNDTKYRGPTGTLEKCKWANSCGLVWDGLKC
jgi:hypothetical protein